MTINFPKTLPYPTVQGYAIKPGEAIVRTEMEAWYKYYAQEGGEWFYITLLGGIGLIEQDARFTQQFEASLLNGRLWEISSELEIRDRPTLSEDEMDVLTEIDLVTLELWTSKLHILVHSSLPYKLN